MAKRRGDEHDILDIIPERFDIDGESHHEQGGHRLRNTLAMLLAVVGVSAVVATIWHFVQGSGPGPGGIPVIRASNGPFKERPENRGGMQIPNQNKLVYRRLEGLPGPDTKNDRLLPGPEQPVAPRAGPAAPPPPASTETLYPGASRAAQAPAVAPPSQTASAAIPQAATAIQPSAPAPQAVVAPQTVAPQPQTKAPAAVAAQPPAAPVRYVPTPAPRPVFHRKEEAGKAKAVAVAHHPVRQVAARHRPAAPTRMEHGDYVVQLAALRTRAAAEVEWRHQLRVNGSLLRGLRPSYAVVHLGARGTFWRLRAGSMSRQAALDLCRRLAQRRQGCLIAHE